ncbi:MAG: NifU N-terminal domain-containing protein [Bacteriovoracaceae bacterium]|nr:NifU N-terminal domain-containing protein [Bacteriovoracaceae bacterium]
MEIKVQTTPNPNSKKFIISQIINNGEKVTFASPEEARGIQLPLAIFTCIGVKKIAMFGNTVTITKAHSADWDIVEDEVIEAISLKINEHNPGFEVATDTPKEVYDSPEMERLAVIVDKDIRPIMQADGGDIQLLKYDTISKILFVSFEGNCGSCASATDGTLAGIKNILEMKFDEDIKVYKT